MLNSCFTCIVYIQSVLLGSTFKYIHIANDCRYVSIKTSYKINLFLFHNQTLIKAYFFVFIINYYNKKNIYML